MIPQPGQDPVYRVLTDPQFAGQVIADDTAKRRRWKWPALAAAVVIVLGGLAIWGWYLRSPKMEVASVDVISR